MIIFKYKGKPIGKIQESLIDKYFIKSLLPSYEFSEYSFFFPGIVFIMSKRWDDKFIFYDFVSFFGLFKDKELFVITPEFLYEVYKKNEILELNWEELEKTEAWWYDLKKMKFTGYENYFDASLYEEYIIIEGVRRLKMESSKYRNLDNIEFDEDTYEIYEDIMPDQILFYFYYDDELIFSINRGQVAKFLNPIRERRGDYTFPPFIYVHETDVLELKNNFYYIKTPYVLVLCRDNEFFVMDPIFLHNAMESRQTRHLYWEDLPKKEIWWKRFNLMFNEGLYKFFDYSPILDKIEAVADKLLTSEWLFKRWFRYKFRSKYYFYHSKEELIDAKNLIKELRAKGGKI